MSIFLAATLRVMRRYRIWIISIICAALIFGTYEFGRYSVYRQHPDLKNQEQAAELLKEVSALIELPQGESPTVITVTNAEEARQGQPFLQNAENGDVLIVYLAAEQAILYRPSAKKLVAVGPIKNLDTTAGTTPPPAPPETEPDDAKSREE